MNKTNIEWCDMTFNPITGCLSDCPYCYAKKIAERFGRSKEEAACLEPVVELEIPFRTDYNEEKIEPYPYRFKPTFHKYRLDEPQKIKKPQNIFVCSMADLFGDWVPDEWIAEVFKACEAAPQHNYLFLTKNPKGYKRLPFYFDKEVWIGTTVSNNADLGTRGYDLFTVMQGMTDNVKSFLSIEPLQGCFNLGTCHTDISHLCHFHWVTIGAETGNRKDKIIPKKEWIDEITTVCDKSQIPVFMKDSLIPIIGEANMRREFPDGLKRGGEYK